MWWLIGSAPDFWGRGPGFESGFSHNDPDALQDQDHCDNVENLRVDCPEAKKDNKKKLGRSRLRDFGLPEPPLKMAAPQLPTNIWILTIPDSSDTGTMLWLRAF